MQITDATAVVTGAASGLGAATARALAGRGARVIGLDLPSALESADEVPGVQLLGCDVTDAGQVGAALDHAVDEARPLRIVVNCAGIAPSARILSRRGTHDPALFAKVVQVNLVGTFTVMALAAERIATASELADGQRGVIVNTASIAAFDGQIGQAAYAASKGGVVGLGLPAARDLAQVGIRVNTIAPGIVETPMLATVSEDFRAGLAAGVPFPPRLGRPDEYAQLALFLIEHDYVNGEVVRMDGALRMAPR
ncbi:SDR family oxidoreductase [Nocardioides sp.]|uniref:SDR family oxidoreductase n=1 Tax=Nocardioides sp. TaxID=35761 RepID=UPI0025ECC511|nr:SDR family oxidoreductase [Nocardioides sp.]